MSWHSDRIEADLEYGEVPQTQMDWADAITESGGAGRMMYVPHAGWFLWDGKSWEPDPEGKGVGALVGEFIACYRPVARAVTDPEKAAKVATLQRKAEAEGYANAITGWLTKKLTARITTLDTDEWLLNTPKGVLDLKSRKLLTHSPGHRMTMLTRGSYDPEALISSRWIQAIREIIPDDDRRQYMQEMAGVSLVGKQLEQIAILMYGPTARNGKSTVGEAIQWAAGTYAEAGDPAILTAADRHPENLAALHRRRLVQFSELPEDKALAAAGFKRLTGDDTITARFLFKDRFSYKPEFMMMIRANDLPYVPGDDEGTWRRLRVVLFDVQFEGTADDRNLRRILQEPGESSAVLTWAVEGLARYLGRPERERYWEPDCVRRDTQELRDSLDPTGQFIRERLQPGEHGSFVSYHDIWVAYTAWWAMQSEKGGMSQASLTRKLKKRPGYRHVMRNGARGISGMALKPASSWLGGGARQVQDVTDE